jgi:ADP-ribose pyrophosphatase
MQPWKTITRRLILDHSKYLKVEAHDIRLPNGDIIRDWPWIITPDFVIIIVVNTCEEFIFFRQQKYSMDGVGLAPVGGYIDDGEVPIEAAQRELAEEIGYVSDSWVHLGSYPVDGNRGAGRAHLYLALNAVPSGSGSNLLSDDLEDQEQVVLTRDDVKTAILRHEFKVLPWMAAVTLALDHMEARHER